MWMRLRGFISSFGWGLVAPDLGYQLTAKGEALAKSRTLPQEDLQRLSGKALTIKPAIYGVSLDPKELRWRTKKLFRRKGT